MDQKRLFPISSMQIVTWTIPAYPWDNYCPFILVVSLPGLGSLKGLYWKSPEVPAPCGFVFVYHMLTCNYLCQRWAPWGHIFHLAWGMLGILIVVHLAGAKEHLSSVFLNWFLRSWSIGETLSKNSVIYVIFGSQLMKISCENKY